MVSGGSDGLTQEGRLTHHTVVSAAKRVGISFSMECMVDVAGARRTVRTQQNKDKNKLYAALYAPEVECIAKGKARKPYEIGVKNSLVASREHGLMLSARTFTGNPDAPYPVRTRGRGFSLVWIERHEKARTFIK